KPSHDVLQEAVAAPGFPEDSQVLIVGQSMTGRISHGRGHDQGVLAGRAEVLAEIELQDIAAIFIISAPVIIDVVVGKIPGLGDRFVVFAHRFGSEVSGEWRRAPTAPGDPAANPPSEDRWPTGAGKGTPRRIIDRLQPENPGGFQAHVLASMATIRSPLPSRP